MSLCFVLGIMFFILPPVKGRASLPPVKDNSRGLPGVFLQNPPFSEEDSLQTVRHQLHLMATSHLSQEVYWWTLYKTARLFQAQRPGLFCKNMNFLSQIEDFPLKSYARLHHYAHCQPDHLSLQTEDFPPWLRRQALIQWHQKARNLQNMRQIMESAHQLYKWSGDTAQKEAYLSKAIQMAGELGEGEKKTRWQAQWHRLVPRFLKNPRLEDMVRVAEDFKKVRKFHKAAFYYRQVLNHKNSSFEDKNKAFKGMRWIYREWGQKKNYLKATRQWKNFLKRHFAQSPQARKHYHDIGILYARSQWTLHQGQKALKSLTLLENTLKNRHSLFMIYRLKALIFAEQKNHSKALDYLQKAFSQKAPDREMWEKTRWDHAWLLKKMNRPAQSLESFKHLREKTQSLYLPSRILFWMAHTYQGMNQNLQARTLYQQLIREDPLSYYGMLAHYKTGQTLSIHPQGYRELMAPAARHKEYQVAFWLTSLGETEAAGDFLKFMIQKKDSALEPLLYYMSRTHLHLPLFQMVGGLGPGERTRYFSSHTSVLFPVLYAKEVERASKIFNVEKEIIYSVIRQESAYNPRARSPADAFGLMQLRPFVARQVARQHGIPYQKTHQLYIPETNILLGTAFLKQLFKKYQHQFILSLAAYNAGEKALSQWIKHKGFKDPLVFIEEIPYEETRTYVRLTVRNFVFYRLLHHPGHSIPFPERVFLLPSPVLKTENKAPQKRTPAKL